MSFNINLTSSIFTNLNLLIFIFQSTCIIMESQIFSVSGNEPIDAEAVSKNVSKLFPHPSSEGTSSCSKEQKDFQRVLDAKYKFYVYSAFFDDASNRNESPVVRIMALASRLEQTKFLRCKFYNEAESFLYTKPLFKIIPTGGRIKFKYESVLITCPSQNQRKKVERPTYVSISSGKGKNDPAKESLTNCLPISYNGGLENQKTKIKGRRRPKSTMAHEFAACVRTSFNYENPTQFLEWIEFYKGMGVSHFTFYNYSIGPITSALMNSYVADGVAQVLPYSNFNLTTAHPDAGTDFELLSYGTLLNGPDCNFRYRGVAKYVLIMDFDELIVPRLHNNYSELIKAINKIYSLKYQGQTKKPAIASYRIASEYFFQYLPDFKGNEKINGDDSEESKISFTDQVKSSLLMNRKVIRSTTSGYRFSKYILNPNKVIIPHYHAMTEMTPNSQEILIGQDLALVHHYRVTNKIGLYSKPIIAFETDTIAHKFSERVSTQIVSRLNQIGLEELKHRLNFNPEPVHLNSFYVITTVFNPISYQNRYKLYHKFVSHLNSTGLRPEQLITVEAIFPTLNQTEFQVTFSSNPNHIQIKSNSIYWIKEGLINLAVSKLPSTAKWIAWMDADLEFSSSLPSNAPPNWIPLTIQALQKHVLVQLFRVAKFTFPTGKIEEEFTSFGFYAANPNANPKYKLGGNPGHPGYGWAMQKSHFLAMGGLPEHGLIGLADEHLAFATLNNPTVLLEQLPNNLNPNYLKYILNWVEDTYKKLSLIFNSSESQAKSSLVGYVHGLNLLHHWHGPGQLRQYSKQWDILVKHNFSFVHHMKRNEVNGLLEFTNDNNGKNSKQMINVKLLEADILNYLKSRREDDEK